jgi:hypothetical protein
MPNYADILHFTAKYETDRFRPYSAIYIHDFPVMAYLRSGACKLLANIGEIMLMFFVISEKNSGL